MESPDRNVVLSLDDDNGEISVVLSMSNLPSGTFDRWVLRLIATESEFIWGGGEQYSFFNLRERGHYPIWVREQGVGRNKSSYLTQVCMYVKCRRIQIFGFLPAPSETETMF